mmetsp:Transcript_31425/g.46636  ORF Transcript_31425/g.46636 Transcript_31425/m.46636 type:complete len:118 (+) Transcript_31425:2-355(+)
MKHTITEQLAASLASVGASPFRDNLMSLLGVLPVLGASASQFISRDYVKVRNRSWFRGRFSAARRFDPGTPLVEGSLRESIGNLKQLLITTNDILQLSNGKKVPFLVWKSLVEIFVR